MAQISDLKSNLLQPDDLSQLNIKNELLFVFKLFVLGPILVSGYILYVIVIIVVEFVVFMCNLVKVKLLMRLVENWNTV